MQSVITQPAIYTALAMGACTLSELYTRLGLDVHALDRHLMQRLGELLHLMERAGIIVSETGAATGELRYAVAMSPVDRPLVERIAVALEQIAAAIKEEREPPLNLQERRKGF